MALQPLLVILVVLLIVFGLVKQQYAVPSFGVALLLIALLLFGRL